MDTPKKENVEKHEENAAKKLAFKVVPTNNLDNVESVNLQSVVKLNPE